jgi:hypothetical protein
VIQSRKLIKWIVSIWQLYFYTLTISWWQMHSAYCRSQMQKFIWNNIFYLTFQLKSNCRQNCIRSNYSSNIIAYYIYDHVDPEAQMHLILNKSIIDHMITSDTEADSTAIMNSRSYPRRTTRSFGIMTEHHIYHSRMSRNDPQCKHVNTFSILLKHTNLVRI